MIRYFFFLQAEDGIRDTSVTGVETCALPISRREISSGFAVALFGAETSGVAGLLPPGSSARAAGSVVDFIQRSARRHLPTDRRSEERRVGKECRCRGARA